jgi:hypothetical protein
VLLWFGNDERSWDTQFVVSNVQAPGAKGWGFHLYVDAT